jgi:ketosteroid isomerase-like protein
MKKGLLTGSLLCLLALFSYTANAQTTSPADLKRQVADTERAFAKSMADRNHEVFTSFLSEEAVFFSGPQPLRGKGQVAQWWKRFYESKDAPFSWEPETVEVLESGKLALSTGTVRDPSGKIVSTFTSIWRLEAPNTWRIVFDKGNRVCDPAK